jgi:hypothetical protein
MSAKPPLPTYLGGGKSRAGRPAPTGVRQLSVSAVAASGQASSSIAALLADSRTSLGLGIGVRERDLDEKIAERQSLVESVPKLTADDQYRRLSIIAGYSPNAVSLPVLLDEMRIGSSRFRATGSWADSSLPSSALLPPVVRTKPILTLTVGGGVLIGNKFFGVVVLADISGFTKLAEALATTPGGVEAVKR